MEVIAAFIYDFRAKYGHFPRSGNAEAIADISAVKNGVGYVATGLSADGTLASANGKSFIILCDSNKWCIIASLSSDGNFLDEYVLISPKGTKIGGPIMRSEEVNPTSQPKHGEDQRTKR